MPMYKDSPEVRFVKKGKKRETVGEIVANGLESELDNKLGYCKYDYRNKETANSRNGYSQKSAKTSADSDKIAVP